jgi:hypothetical protein
VLVTIYWCDILTEVRERSLEIRFTLCVPFHYIIIKIPKHWLGGVKKEVF